MRDWTEFGLRDVPAMSARTKVRHVPGRTSVIDPYLADVEGLLARPLVGITTDGRPPEQRLRRPTGVPTDAIREAATAFLSLLEPDVRAKLTFPLRASEWRMWCNVHMNFYRHGVMLEDLPMSHREAFLRLLEVTLSARGYRQARDIMRLNELLSEVSGSPDEFGEWPYFVSFFGAPSDSEPWGFQYEGHHLSVNVVVIGDELVTTPLFMGSEPCAVREGRFAGISVMGDEQRSGLTLMRSLDPVQQATALQYASIMPDQIPRHLQHFIDGRMQAGAFKDNVVLPYCGVRADGFSDRQRRLLRDTIATYVGWTNEPHAAVKMRDVDATLDETWFSWMGGTGPEDPFYYRVHSPVVLIEFDHHPGVVFDNKEPSHHHVHSIIRTPNGGDYGHDLLGDHLDEFDHHDGRHH